MIAVGATDSELEFFLATSKRLGLDPFARQIWFVKRPKRVEDSRGEATYVDVGEPQTSIDGFRTVAERSGEYEGQGVMTWCGPDGKWLDVWTSEKPPTAARAVIFRKEFREPLVSVALFSEFCPKYRNGKSPVMWIKMPANQLAKCAEAAGLRRAFPRDLSGVHTDDEMEHVYAEGSGYVAPAVATIPTKAIDERKETKPLDHAAASDLGSNEVVITEANVVAETLKEVASSDIVSELDREIANMLLVLGEAQTRDAMAPIGNKLTAAKDAIKAGKGTDRDRLIVEVVEPAIQKRWRELAPKKGSR
jgi:phage recombination protein Bet